jgi:hypothetical protein
MAIVYPPVLLNESVISAGAPITLQSTVAYVSFGATSLPVGTRQLVTSTSSLVLPTGSWLIAALNTFFAQGSAGAYVIELGTTASNVQAVATAVLGTETNWTVSAIAVDVGGSGWAVGNTFSFPGGVGTVATEAAGVVETVTLGATTPQTTNPAGTGVPVTPTGASSGIGLTLNVTSTNAQVSNQQLASVTVTNAGNGYSSAPAVNINGGGGTGATAAAIVNGGQITSIVVTSPGENYTSVPTVAIGAPPSNVAQQIQEYITANQQQNYLYVIDPTNSVSPAVEAIIANYDFLTSYTYFLLTMNATQAATFGSHKAAILFTPAVATPSTELAASMIAFAFASLVPSATSKIKPFNFRFALNCTVFGLPSSSALQAVIGSNTNVIIPATAGGLPNNMLLGGQTSDGNAINLWYGADYASLNVTQALNNEIIEGSNDDENPLDYDQQGINRLVARTIQTLNAAITVGAILGPVTVNSIDFATYVLANPSDYQAGIYNGIAFTITPTRGFGQITYGMTVDFTAASVAATAQ